MEQPDNDKPSYGAVRIVTTSYGTQLHPKDLTDKQYNFNLVLNVSASHGLYQVCISYLYSISQVLHINTEMV